MWVLENPKSIFYYVEHAPLNLNISNQDDTPFTLGIQTTWQCEMMMKYRQGSSMHSMQHLAPINAGYGIIFYFLKLCIFTF
jgi:hypothetical protein